MALPLRSLCVAALVGALTTAAGSASAGPPHKLWVAFEKSTQQCKPHVDGMLQCLFNETNFDDLLAAWPGGETLTPGGPSVVLGSSCSDFDWQCVVNQTKWAVSAGDAVAYIRGTQSCGGGENHHNPTITVGGKTIPIRGATVWATDCDCETWFLIHESYEAATPTPSSADCCNGQNKNNAFGAGCYQKFGPAGSIAVDGNYKMTCSNGTFGAQYLSPSGQQNNVNACEKLTVGPSCGKAVDEPCAQDTDCCQNEGLVCQLWDYDGDPPFAKNCCKPIGKSCGAPTDCCGGSDCQNGSCVCVPAGGWCLNADECCAGFVCDTMSNACVAAPPMTTASVTSSASESSSVGVGAGGSSTVGTGGLGGAGGGAIGAGGAGGGLSEGGSPDEPAGCSCRAAGQSDDMKGALLLALAIGASMRRRSRRGSARLVGDETT